MRKYCLLFFFMVSSVAVSAQFARSFARNVSSLQMVLNDDWVKPPVITLGSDDELLFSFDELSHTYKRFIYRITHCNADWTPSDLHAIDYIDGFNDRPIDYWENSVTTTQLYTH